MELQAQRFVYVDDNQEQRDLLLLEFEAKRHWNDVRCLEGVLAFRDYLASDDTPPIDVLIVDWRLLDGVGSDVIQMARSHPKSTDAKILVVSAVSEQAQIDQADRAGGHYWLEKPLTVDLIKDALAAINGFGEVIVRKRK